jgi:uncharacterized BrkB/YihY/UPF0761 family membrane protein
VSSETQEQREPPISMTALIAAAVILALPAGIPLLIIARPELVPMVDAADDMAGVLIAISALILLVNWGFLYVIYRWVEKMVREEG